MGINKKLFTGDAGGLVAAENFAPVIYTGSSGTGGTKNVTGVGFEADLIWIKNRDTTAAPTLFNSVSGENARGYYLQLVSNDTDYEAERDSTGWETPYGGLTTISSDGFTVEHGNSTAAYIYNGGSKNFVAWCWKAPDSFSHSASGSQLASTGKSNQSAGFSIVSYTGNNSSGATVKHNLGGTPELMIVKRRDATSDWDVYSATTGETKYLILDTNQSVLTASNIWNNTVPDDSVFTIGNHSSVNANSGTYIAYCFKSVSGYSKIGAYDGHTTNATRIYTTDNGSSGGANGFTPRFVMIKRTDSTGDWFIYDSVRGNTAGTGAPAILFPNSSEAEYTINNTALYMTFHSDGFQPATGDSGINGTSRTFLYYAIA
tara:strand:- start:13731 stop:14852 length:1122 start_codon:yes stop_codon:yes gene_type:complete